MSCLFRALAAFHRGISAEQMRHIIANFLARDPHVCDGLRLSEAVAPMSAAEYVARLRNPGFWGGAIEIRAYSILARRRVIVVVRRSVAQSQQIVFEPPHTSDRRRPAIMLLWTGNHYEPMSRVNAAI